MTPNKFFVVIFFSCIFMIPIMKFGNVILLFCKAKIM
jgi:hypothetical protein